MAMELRLLLLLRNLRDSLRTCFPVKPDAPKIMMSNVVPTAVAIITFVQIFCFKQNGSNSDSPIEN